MKMTFRWYGTSDSIPLSYIKQIQGMTGVVTAIYDVPVGEIWPLSELEKQKKLVTAAGLEMEVIESIPVHEDIKKHTGDYLKYVANYKQTLINLAKCGIKTV